MTAGPDTLLPALQNRQVRDLAWACFSQPLLRCADLDDASVPVSNCGLALTLARRRWLLELDADNRPLSAYLGDAREGRLGLYFERLWHFFLENDPAVELVAHNLAVRQDGQTLGEFDCLYYCRERQHHVHLELAVKFYLQSPGTDGSQWRHWIGPDTTDRLDRKLHRLFAHQLLLGDMPAARPALAGRGIGSLQRELEMKGRLFSHPGTTGNRPSACAAPPPGQRYVTLGELRRGGMTGTGYRILKRWEWLAPVISGSGRLLDARDLHSRVGGVVARDKRPVQVAECCPDGRELCRFFVVPDHWPALAASA